MRARAGPGILRGMWEPPGIPRPVRSGADLVALRRELSRRTGHRYGRRELAEDLAAIGAPRTPAALLHLEHARHLPDDLARALEHLRALILAHGRPSAPPELPSPASSRPRTQRLRHPPKGKSEGLRRL